MSICLSRRSLLGAGVVGPSPPKSPDTITGLAAWFKADTIAQADASAVATWADSTANARNLTQGTASSQPTYRTNVINGLPVVRFDGTDDRMVTAAFTLNHPVTLALVAKSSGNGYYLDGLTGNSRLVQRNSDTNFRIHSGVILDTAVATHTAFFVVVMTFNGTSSKVWFKGGPSNNGNTGSNTGSGIAVGSSGAGANFIAADIAEIAAYNVAVPTVDVDGLGRHLAEKYGLTWTQAT